MASSPETGWQLQHDYYHQISFPPSRVLKYRPMFSDRLAGYSNRLTSNSFGDRLPEAVKRVRVNEPTVGDKRDNATVRHRLWIQSDASRIALT